MDRDREYRWIHCDKGLQELARMLKACKGFALDSESNSGFAYRERLCLLQVNDRDHIWLVDLLALQGGADALGPLRPILEDPRREIWLHGGEFDVGCLKRDYDIQLRGVWDTQQAASFLGWEKTGYGAVVKRLCGVSLPKEYAHNDWSQRPIRGEILRYALNDVRYLPEIASALKTAVHRADLEEEVAIACGAVEEATWNGGYQPEGLWNIKGARRLPLQAQRRLLVLFRWRDLVAQQLDLPPGRTVHSKLLLALSRNPPSDMTRLRRMGLSKRIGNEWVAVLLELLANAIDDPPALPPAPRGPFFDRRMQARGERLKKWRRGEAERRGVPLQVVLPMAALKHIQEHGAGDLSTVPQLGPKRIRLYGEKLRECDVSRS